MVEAIYETEVLVNDSKKKIFSLVLYVHIRVHSKEVCKIPLELDTLTADMYYATLEYEVFIESRQNQRIEQTKPYVEQLKRLYTNVELIKSELQK